MNPVSLGQLLHFFFCKINSLIGSNITWHIIMIDKHSMGPLMVEFLAEASLVAMANLYPEWVHIQVRKNPVPFMRKISNVSYLPPSIWLVHLGNDVISGAQDLFLYWHIKHTALGVAWSVLVKERTYFESINSLYSWHYKHFVKDPWPSTVVAWGRNWHSPISLCLFIIESLLSSECPLVIVHLRHKYLQILC